MQAGRRFVEDEKRLRFCFLRQMRGELDALSFAAPVWQEILSGQDDDIAKLKRTQATTSSVTIENYNLGTGETAVLNLALTTSKSRVIIDDYAARKCAKALGIKFFGTGGLLILAKQKGLIDSVSESLEKVQNSGLWLSDTIIELLKQKAGE